METFTDDPTWDIKSNTLTTYCEVNEHSDVKIVKDGHGAFAIMVPGKDNYAREGVQKTLILLEQLAGLGHKIPARVMDTILQEGLLGEESDEIKENGSWVSISTGVLKNSLNSITTENVCISIQVFGGSPRVIIFPQDKKSPGHFIRATVVDFDSV